MEVLKPSSLTTADILITSLVPNPANINQMDETTLQRLVDEIKEVGFIDPIDVVPREDQKYLILGGEHRWRAANIAGLSYVPCVIHTDEKWNDEDIFNLVAFRLNVLKGSQNPEKFMKTYERLSQKFGNEKLQDIFAVTDKSLWKKLTKNIKKDLAASGVPQELVNQIAKAEDKSKDFNQFTRYLNKIFKDHANQVSNGSVVFVNGKNEHLIIQASEKTFQAIRAISNLANAENKNINEYLESVLMQFMGLN